MKLPRSPAHPPLTSCCAARFLTGLEDPCSTARLPYCTFHLVILYVLIKVAFRVFTHCCTISTYESAWQHMRDS